MLYQAAGRVSGAVQPLGDVGSSSRPSRFDARLCSPPFTAIRLVTQRLALDQSFLAPALHRHDLRAPPCFLPYCARLSFSPKPLLSRDSCSFRTEYQWLLTRPAPSLSPGTLRPSRTAVRESGGPAAGSFFRPPPSSYVLRNARTPSPRFPCSGRLPPALLPRSEAVRSDPATVQR
jgi:hypothetical protein